MSSLDICRKRGGSALLLALALAAIRASAQSPPTEESAAALERKQREAVNPMRLIIEASKLKPRTRPAAAASGPPRAAPPSPSSSSSSSDTEPIGETSAPQPTADIPAPLPEFRPSDAANPTGAARPVTVTDTIDRSQPSAKAVGGTATAPATRTDALAAVAVQRAATLPTATSAPVLATARSPSPPAPEPAPTSKPARIADPRQIAYQPPDVPPSVIARLDRDTEVQIRYVIERSGATSGAEVVGRPNRGLDRPALDAVGKWRFEPTDEPVTRVVRIVFKAPTD
jgi:TonB family protein